MGSSEMPIQPRDQMTRHGSPIQTAIMKHVSAMNGAHAFFLASFMSLDYRGAIAR
jgi:hypothetical protein